ncbi:MAG: hypothetical protein K2M41_09260 [Muribaculaceae bacterium]|nr:hypothetical protein [Muribaculaceae bacterium]
MKSFNKIILSLGVAAASLGLSSCVGDLDLQPRDPSQTTDVTNDIDRVFADIYLNFSTYGANGNSPVGGFDGGMAAFQRAMFIAEEIPTDEACWLWDPADYGAAYNGGMFNPNQGCLYGAYSRLIINITLCNQFIQNVDNGYFNLDEEGKKRAANYRLQAKALWGACYYYMLSFYNRVPYADENTPVGALPTQLSRTEVYNRVTAALEDVVAEFGANQVPVYGFVGLDMAESVLAKIYLNAEVFTGTPAYDKCYAHSKNVIDRLGKGGYYGNGLARSYNALFGANNDKYVIGNAGSDVDQNCDGVIDDNDLIMYHSKDPKVTLTWNNNFSWKNWDLGFSLRANIGNYVYNNLKYSNSRVYNVSAAQYQLGNLLSDTYLFKNSASANNLPLSSYFVENASFLRCDNITLGYTFRDLFKGNGMLRIFAAVQNPFVITTFSGIDPEEFGGVQSDPYPRPITTSLGLVVTF